MEKGKSRNNAKHLDPLSQTLIYLLIAVMAMPFDIFAYSPSQVKQAPTATPNEPQLPTEIPLDQPLSGPAEVVVDTIQSRGDTLEIMGPVDSIPVVDSQWVATSDTTRVVEAPEWETRDVVFNPDPSRAVWLSALFPGLGQIYNRRYWKLPIIVGGYLGLGYATNWNNNMLRDYTRAYNDVMDNDPSTNSYMDFFPTTTSEESLDKTWLTNVLKSRKNYYRRNRDLCIICMVGVYLVAMLDAYVDASLSHFDISPDLSMDVAPAVIQDGRNRLPSLGLQWALTF